MALAKLTVLALAVISAALPEPAAMVPGLERRALFAGGGFALITAGACPPASSSSATSI
jgi:hypothetical protein